MKARHMATQDAVQVLKRIPHSVKHSHPKYSTFDTNFTLVSHLKVECSKVKTSPADKADMIPTSSTVILLK
uniref:Uncharacterized protein n=1 Tax=Timema tahoe TaxID=61484 RepID=A0A7R9IU56_9NEOP|nr:unnamed protein product [Timema tahoe]